MNYKYTINQFVKILEDYATANKLIKTFFKGEITELNAKSQIKYPLMYVATPNAFTVTETSIVYSFSVVFGDIVTNKHVIDVISDQSQNATDMMAYLYQPSFIYFTASPYTVTPFIHTIDDDIAGVTVNFNITQKFNNDYCSIPMN